MAYSTASFSENKHNKHADDEFDTVSQITPFLFITSHESANDSKKLIKHKINVIIQMNTEESDVKQYARMRIAHHWFPIDDDEKTALPLRDTFRIINRAIARGKRVLVHCRIGASRSPAVVIGYLLQKAYQTKSPGNKESEWDRVYLSIRDKRCIDPNDGFIDQLKALDKTLLARHISFKN